MDTHTITELFKRERKPHIFAPLGNGAYFRSIGIAADRTHILDWWEGRRIEVDLPAEKGTVKAAFDLTCSPCQHFTGRTAFDRFKSLWASWVLEEVSPQPAAGQGVKVFFGGDTGYRAVGDGDDEDTVPQCPAFKEIGAHWGGFDLALIPIGYALIASLRLL